MKTPNTIPLILFPRHDVKHSHESQGPCDCDCACAGGVGYLLKQIPSSQVFIGISAVEYKLIDNFHSLAFNPLIGNCFTVVNTAGRDLLESFRNPRRIDFNDDLEIISGIMNSGLLEVKDEKAEVCISASPQILSAWLHLTDCCNLRCSYCYLPHVREDMLSGTGHAAVDALIRSAVVNNFKKVKIKYAGGEPLLCFSLLVELHSYAVGHAETHGIELEGVVLSNGTLLTAEMIETLKSLNLRLMVSLDGLGHYHDSHRSYTGGRGSFEDVADAVDLALSHGLTPNISVTVSSRTAEGLPEIMAWILDRDLPFSLNFYRQNELSASHQDMQLDEEKIINSMLTAFKVMENNLPCRSFLGGIVDRANLSAAHTHTCGVGQNYLVFDQNGQVAKCQMHIRKPVTDVNAVDPLALIRADRIGIQNLPVKEKKGCKTCEWRHWCAGGCPLATHRVTGRYDVKSPNCNIYKALFPEALRLEGLRLLKYQDDPEVVVKM